MIEIMSGHLGSGSWKVKFQDNIPFLSHRLAFSPKSEFRIGADEILDVQVTAINGPSKRITITLTDERECTAEASEEDVDALLKMVSSSHPAPAPQEHQQPWIKGLVLFFIACFIFELMK